MIDWSPRMIELAKEAIRVNCPDRKVEDIRVANAGSLPYPEHHFDRIWSNYVLHLVPDADAVLRECIRVLRPGGIAVFTVWGRPKNCSRFTLTDRVKERLGLAPARLNPSFHLSDREALRMRLLKAGFRRALAWYQFELFDCHDAPSVVDNLLSTPQEKKFLLTLTPEQIERYREALLSEANQYFEKGMVIGTEALFAAGFL